MTIPNAGAVSEVLNLPLDVVDTGFESYASSIEDDAGIGIAMCFSHDDAAAIVDRVNACTALRQQLAELQLEVAGHNFVRNERDRLVRHAEALEQQLSSLQHENEEQARLLGASGSREARLVAEVAELQREKAAAVGLQEGTALVVRQLEQQLAEMRGALENVRKELHKPGAQLAYRAADALSVIETALSFRERNDAGKCDCPVGPQAHHVLCPAAEPTPPAQTPQTPQTQGKCGCGHDEYYHSSRTGCLQCAANGTQCTARAPAAEQLRLKAARGATKGKCETCGLPLKAATVHGDQCECDPVPPSIWAKEADATVSTHSDDHAVERFAMVMRAKLKLKRGHGRSGWERCSLADLARMLVAHVGKGDPVDIANFAMMLYHRELSSLEPGGVKGALSTARAPAADDVPSMRCPKCGESMPDHDGFGVLHHEKCGYCTHVSRTNGVCELCGDGARAPAVPPMTAAEAIGWMETAKRRGERAIFENGFVRFESLSQPPAQPAVEREGVIEGLRFALNTCELLDAYDSAHAIERAIALLTQEK